MKSKALIAILGFALLLRLYHVTHPIYGWQEWRQADTAAMSRNFYQNGFQLLSPQIDWGGDSTGIVESEFPIYSYLVSLLYTLFGVHDAWGRVLSVLFSLATIFGLYRLVRKYISESAALWSAFIYAVLPLNVYFGRAFMPESGMLMCSVWGIYWFSEWIEHPGFRYFILSCVSISLAVLLKIPALYLGLPLLFLGWCRFGSNTVKTGRLWAFAVLTLLPVAAWYYHAHRLFLESGLTFNIWGFGTDKWGNTDLLIRPDFYYHVIIRLVAERHLTFAGFPLFVIGLFVKRRRREEFLFDVWLIAVCLYVLIVAGGNKAHDYYQLPLILPAAVFIGKVFAVYLPLTSLRNAFRTRWTLSSYLTLSLVGIVAFSIARLNQLGTQEDDDASLVRLAAAVERSTGPTDLIIAVSLQNPVMLYRCDRKGWHPGADQIDSTYLASHVRRGAKFLVGNPASFASKGAEITLQKLLNDYPVAERGSDYFVIRLSD